MVSRVGRYKLAYADSHPTYKGRFRATARRYRPLREVAPIESSPFRAFLAASDNSRRPYILEADSGAWAGIRDGSLEGDFTLSKAREASFRCSDCLGCSRVRAATVLRLWRGDESQVLGCQERLSARAALSKEES